MYKRIVVGITTAILAGFVAYGPFIHPPKASAWTNANTGQCGMDLNWDWKDKILALAKADDGATGDPVGSKYDVDSTFWKGVAIYQDTTYHSGSEFGVVLLAPGTNYKMEFYKESGTYKVKFGTGADVLPSQYSAGQGVYEFKINTSSKSVSVIGLVPSTSATTHTALICITTAKGATYASTWDAQQFSTVIPLQNSADCNGALDVVCWVKKGFNGVANTITDVAQAAFRLLANMFIPDGTVIKAQFDEFTTFMDEKLGFMVYPFEYINDIFTAFTSTSNNWCTSSSNCTRNFGNLLGHPLVVDLAEPADSMGSIWSYVLLALRGLTVLELILAIWKKTKAVTAK